MLRETTITGLHHITVIAGDPQANLDFYVGVLGMRLVKKTVNQDVPGKPPDLLGTKLVLPPWLEAERPRIEAALPPLRDPRRSPLASEPRP